MGFLTPPSLGFNSTIGAFIGGAARGLNEQVLAQQEQDAKLEQIRQAKFQANHKEWLKEKKELEKEDMAQNYFNEVFGPGQASKSAMQLYKLGVKIPDIVSSMSNSIPSGSSVSNQPQVGNTSTGNAPKNTYYSNSVQSIQPGSDSKPNPVAPSQLGLNGPIGGTRVPGPNENFPGFTQPPNPNNQITGGPGYPGKIPSQTATPAPSPAPSNQTTTNPYYGYAEGGQVDPNQAAYLMQAGPQGTDQQPPQMQPAQQQQPIPMGGQNAPVMSDASNDLNNPQNLQSGQQLAQAVPGTIIPSNSNKPMTPYQQHSVGHEDQTLELSKQRFQFEQQQRAFENQRKIEEEKNKFNPAQTEFSKTVFDESSKGQYTGFARQNAQSTVTDANSGLQMLADGTLKTNQIQPIIDSANRLFSSVGIDTLSNLGLANDVNTMNYLNKIVSRSQFGEISKYHLGRWTQMEVAMLARQVASGQSDFNTNAKILLLNRGAAAEQMRFIDTVRQAARHGDKEDINKAMDAVNNFQPSEGKLWAQVDGTDPENTAKAIMQMKPGSWIEDTSNHKMFYLNSIKDGQINLMSDRGAISIPVQGQP